FMYLNTTVPQRGCPVRLSCSSTTATMFYLFNTNVDQTALTTCTATACFNEDYGRNGQIFYRFGTSSGQAHVDILSLNRARDETVWSCSYQNDQPSQFNLTVFSIPQGLNITQEGDMNTDLSMASTSIECNTIGCSYPAPVIQWLYRDQSASTGFEVFRNVSSTVMAGSCVRPEEVYTSRLNLSRMTTLNDNSDRTVTFSCRIEYPDPSLNIIATETKKVTFAVRVTSAVMQQNNMNITNTLSVTSDEALTLTCVTGTSRPSPIINWYIGSEWKSTGTSLNFIPRATDHDKFIYCLVYNTDPNLNVSSNTARLYVRVRVTEAVLQQNNTNITDRLNVTLGEQAALSCLTGTSRPAPTIDWFIGSEWKGSGTSLTFIPSNTDHNKIIKCQAYNIDLNQKVDSSTLKLYVTVYVSSVNLDPPENPVIFLEGTEKSLRCITSSCRPQPVIRWWVDGMEVTDLSRVSVTPTDTLYTASSELRLTLNRTHQGKKVYCHAKVNGQVNAAESEKPGITVWYAPHVEVNFSGPTVIGSTAVLICVPKGNPPQYRFHPWIHTFGQTEIRRLEGVNTVNNSTLTLSDISIQDMGTYTCTVDNSITGPDGQINQTGDTQLFTQGPPVIGETQPTFPGEINTSKRIAIPFYSYSAKPTVKFIKQLSSSELYNTSDISIYVLPSNITLMFYSKKEMIPGYEAVLYFKNVKAGDFDNYTVLLLNNWGNVTTMFALIASVRPEKPFNFHPANVQEKQLSLRWQAGYNGGYTQTFIVEISHDNITWNNVSQVSAGNKDGWFTTIIEDLIPGSEYYLRLYAYNINGRGDLADVQLAIRTFKDVSASAGISVGGAVGAGVGGAVGGIVLGFIGAII
ncbi:hypothetical protein ACJMK2_027394, partial [Sinanodonta woodiana]